MAYHFLTLQREGSTELGLSADRKNHRADQARPPDLMLVCKHFDDIILAGCISAISSNKLAGYWRQLPDITPRLRTLLGNIDTVIVWDSTAWPAVNSNEFLQLLRPTRLVIRRARCGNLTLATQVIRAVSQDRLHTFEMSGGLQPKAIVEFCSILRNSIETLQLFWYNGSMNRLPDEILVPTLPKLKIFKIILLKSASADMVNLMQPYAQAAETLHVDALSSPDDVSMYLHLYGSKVVGLGARSFGPEMHALAPMLHTYTLTDSSR